MRRRVIFWQRAPFHIFVGGDGLYLHQLKKYFKNAGWDVVTITSHIHRPYLFARSKYHLRDSRSKIRGSAQFDRYYVFNPISVLMTFFMYIKNKAFDLLGIKIKQSLSAAEARWLEAELNSTQPDLVIKCFDKLGYKDFANLRIDRRIHLIGFMNTDEYVFKDQKLNSNRSIDSRSLENFTVNDNIGGSKLPSIAFSSKFDRDRLNSHLHDTKSIYVGIGFESNFAFQTTRDNTAIFVGNKTSTNESAVELLVTKIWPAVLKKVPNAKLKVIGRVCSYFKQSYAGVELMGEIDDLDAEYRNAKLVVAPLLVGSAGVKTKVAEGLAYGRVVVTTSLGVDSSDPDQLKGAAFIEDDPDRFANAVCALLQDDDLRISMETAAKAVFEQNYSYDSAYRDLSEWIGAESHA